VYRRSGRPVAVLGVDATGPFARWRRQLETAPLVTPVPEAGPLGTAVPRDASPENPIGRVP
jgi:hypothetical protein